MDHDEGDVEIAMNESQKELHGHILSPKWSVSSSRDGSGHRVGDEFGPFELRGRSPVFPSRNKSRGSTDSTPQSPVRLPGLVSLPGRWHRRGLAALEPKPEPSDPGIPHRGNVAGHLGIGEDEKYLVPGFHSANDQPAYLFSSANQRTILRHFEWMRQYGIDGVFVQRFLVNLKKPSFDKVLEYARSSAKKTGRVYAVCYDLTGVPSDRLYDRLVTDWKRLVDEEKITNDERYLHHNDKPVLFVWGFFEDRFDADLAHRLIDFFKSNDRYRVTLIGGCQWHWRTAQDAEWARGFRRFDVISPWNVGNYAMINGKKIAATDYWKADLAEAKRHGMEYLPVVYPGFGWTNLKGKNAEGATIPRRGGAFFWEQFVKASELEIDMAYVAMFDEVDEATAIFKVTNTPPIQVRFQIYEGLPSDWYLRLTGEGTKLIRGQRKASLPFPIQTRQDRAP